MARKPMQIQAVLDTADPETMVLVIALYAPDDKRGKALGWTVGTISLADLQPTPDGAIAVATLCRDKFNEQLLREAQCREKS